MKIKKALLSTFVLLICVCTCISEIDWEKFERELKIAIKKAEKEADKKLGVDK